MTGRKPIEPREWERELPGWNEFPRRWPDRESGPYELRFTFALLNGRQECIGVNVRSFPMLRTERTDKWEEQAQPVTTAVLRSIPVGRIIDEIRDYMSDEHTPARYGPYGELPPDKVEAIRQQWLARSGSGGRPPKYDVEHWIEVAKVYQEAYTANRTPTRAVARWFGVSQSVAGKWVARCRKLGLLPPTSRGRARGGVTIQAEPATIEVRAGETQTTRRKGPKR